MREQSSRRELKWSRLDNTANLFPVIATERMTNVYRLSLTLDEEIDPELLQQALDKILPLFDSMNVRLRTGAFWYYFETNRKPAPRVERESEYPCRKMEPQLNNQYLFRVSYYKKRINLEVFHVLADGMGGHNAGDFASRCAVSVIEASVKKDMSFNPIKIMRHAIEEANEKIHELAKADAGKAGMGTTLVAVTVVGYYAYVANVGDSRLYISGEQGLVQITRDHSWIAEMVMRGELSKEEARNHPDKNIITRALGASEEVDIDFFDVQLEEKNRILLCSDGLSNMVADEEIQKILGDSPDIEQSGRQLVATANTNGGRDNISVILIEPFTNEVKEC